VEGRDGIAQDPQAALRRLVEGFARGDEQTLRAVLAPKLTAYVTNAEGGVDRVDGRDAYMRRLLSLKARELSVGVTQSVGVAPAQALAMVEIRARRQGRTLHNFAAFLARVEDRQVAELWMVEALPAYSDEFWR
jgi:ketosteroid isomerase-like protein